jgi:hypothetical protein
MRRRDKGEAKHLALTLLSPQELEAVFFDSCQTAQAVRELVGCQVVTAWIKGKDAQ